MTRLHRQVSAGVKQWRQKKTLKDYKEGIFSRFTVPEHYFEYAFCE